MKLLTSFAAFVYLCTALILKCGPRKDFSSPTLDVVNFVPSVAYNDFVNGIYLYKNLLDNGTLLFVNGAGVFYERNADGTCVKNKSPIEDIQITEFLTYTDGAGVYRTGLEETAGDYNTKFLVNEATEFIVTTNAKDAEHIQVILKQFEVDDCPLSEAL